MSSRKRVSGMVRADGGSRKGRLTTKEKHAFVVRADPEVVRKAKYYGLNLQRVCEKALEDAVERHEKSDRLNRALDVMKAHSKLTKPANERIERGSHLYNEGKMEGNKRKEDEGINEVLKATEELRRLPPLPSLKELLTDLRALEKAERQYGLGGDI